MSIWDLRKFIEESLPWWAIFVPIGLFFFAAFIHWVIGEWKNRERGQ